ncbi:MAG: GPW/gp25 family protein [Minicystis sp.]
MKRRDYAFPFRIDGASGKGALAPSHEAHVQQMIRQVLLTAPGERTDLPTFGCGLRRLLFAPNAEPLAATAQVLVLQSLKRWLASAIDVKAVRVLSADDSGDESRIIVQVEYVLRETRETSNVEVLIQ